MCPLSGHIFFYLISLIRQTNSIYANKSLNNFKSYTERMLFLIPICSKYFKTPDL